MLTVPSKPLTRTLALRAAALGGASLLLILALSACGTSQTKPVAKLELAAAQTFPYYPVYWVGPSFEGQLLAAADGLNGYLTNVGDGVYYGNCVEGKGIFKGGSSCLLPLQVTTVVYRRHFNESLGPQHNILVRGVPAVEYDEGRSLEVYSGHVAIDIFSDSLANALRAAQRAVPGQRTRAARTKTCRRRCTAPGLYGPQEIALARVTENLPGHVCQHAAKQIEFLERVRKSH